MKNSRSSELHAHAALEERMLRNQIIHFTLDFTENSNLERKKIGERRYRRLHACLGVDRSGLPVGKGSPPPKKVRRSKIEPRINLP